MIEKEQLVRVFNEPRDVFEKLFDDPVLGFPPHVVSIQLFIDMENNSLPYANIIRIETEGGKFLIRDGEAVRVQERYRLSLRGDRIIAVFEGEPRSEDDSNP